MNDIKETRLIRIQNRIIKNADLLKLANALFKEYKLQKKSDKYTGVSFSATCDDDSLFDSESTDIFSDLSPLSSKRIISIKMYVGSIISNRQIHIHINHSTSYYNQLNYIEVKGTDPKWVNGTLKILEEIVDGFTPQNTFVKKYSLFFHTIFAISIGVIILNILGYFITIANLPQTTSTSEGLSGLIVSLATKYAIARALFIYLSYWLFGLGPAGYLVKKLRDLWPSIEIQVGAEHKFIEKRRRGWLINIFLIGILPISLQVIYDIIKLFLK